MAVCTVAAGACGSVYSASVHPCHALGAGRVEGRREGRENGRQKPVFDPENMLVGS